MFLLIGIIALLIVMYVAVVSGSFKKLGRNGIYLKGKAKYLFPFVPLVLFFLHLGWSIKNFKNPKLAGRIMYMFIFKYPVVLGMLIELLVEQIAMKLSEDEKIVKLNKSKSVKKAVQRSKALELEDVPSKKSKNIFKEYQSLYSSPAS